MNEIWQPIENWEGLYQISNMGRIRSLDRMVKSRGNSYRLQKGKVLKTGTSKDGYLQVTLSQSNKCKHAFIHRLVAQAFIPNPYHYPEVNHKDENKSNNCVSNLEWCNRKYNVNYGTCLKRTFKATLNGKCSKPVVQLTINDELIQKWPSMMEVERTLGINSGSISRCCRGKQKTAHGYRWKYVN